MFKSDVFQSCVRADLVCQVYHRDRYNLRIRLSSTLTCFETSIFFCRFPIPDMRPSSQRTWWAPALRADYVVIHIDEATAEYSTHSNPASFTAEFSKLNCKCSWYRWIETISYWAGGWGLDLFYFQFMVSRLAGKLHTVFCVFVC